MAREIRITIDDDEVFERMKRQKDELDLSWREVLQRGLWSSRSLERALKGSHGRFDDSEFGRDRLRRARGHHGRNRFGHHGGDRRRDFRGSPFDPDFGERLRTHIERSIDESMRDVEPFTPGSDPFEFEIEELADAEDAVVRFDFLGDDEERRIPLRVNLRTSDAGLDVDVVTVRRGKSAGHMNRFTTGDRRQITTRLSSGETATLELDEGVEEYDIVPMVSWGRDESGRPTVVDVEISTVRFDEQ